MPQSSGLTLAQEQALALIPKITSSLSIPCSLFLIYEIYCDHSSYGTSSIQRILVGMSIVDILASSAWFLSTWAVPEGSFAYAAGNQATCNFQGFLLQMAIGAPLYNSSLALFYTLIVKMRWRDDQLVQMERWVHFFILSFTIGTSILLLFLEQYNHVGAVCWVIGDPQDCGNSSFQENLDVPCNRGEHAWIYGVLLFYGPLWVCVIACSTSMVILYQEVRKTVGRTMRYGSQHSLGRSGENTSKVAKQAILYSLTFLITWMPSTLWSIAHWFQWKHYALDVAAATAEPLQGLWNFLVFLRSRPATVQKIQTLLDNIFPCCCHRPEEDSDAEARGGESRRSVAMSIKKRLSVFVPMIDPNDLSGLGNSTIISNAAMKSSTIEHDEMMISPFSQQNSQCQNSNSEGSSQDDCNLRNVCRMPIMECSSKISKSFSLGSSDFVAEGANICHCDNLADDAGSTQTATSETMVELSPTRCVRKQVEIDIDGVEKEQQSMLHPIRIDFHESSNNTVSDDELESDVVAEDLCADPAG